MRGSRGWRRFWAGSLAGLAASALMRGMQFAGMKLAPGSMPPLKRDPGEHLVQKAEELLERSVPAPLKQGAVLALGIGYGVSFALLFAASRRRVRSLPLEGSALGLATWAAGYLGWLPALKLMPPVHKQKPVQVVGAVASHLAFGLLTAALYEKLRRKL